MKQQLIELSAWAVGLTDHVHAQESPLKLETPYSFLE